MSGENMKSQRVVMSCVAGTLFLTANSYSKQTHNTGFKCQDFEQKVKHHAKTLKLSPLDNNQRATMGKTLVTPAKKLAFALVTGFNMTPHNSAYVAGGLCSMQKVDSI